MDNAATPPPYPVANGRSGTPQVPADAIVAALGPTPGPKTGASGTPPPLFGTGAPGDPNSYASAMQDYSNLRSNLSRTPMTTYKNSLTHPINVSWLIPAHLNMMLQEDMRLPPNVQDLNELADRELLHTAPLPPVEESLAKARELYPNWRPRGNMGLCSCPGKKVRLDGPVNGRAKIERDLDLDFARLQQLGCKRVICCLFDEELAFLGSPFPQYLQAATNHGIDVVRIPMVEGSTPETFAEMEPVLDKIDETTNAGHNVIAHCRGGVGRAAVVACCWLLRKGLILNDRSVISWVRRYRTSKAIETDEQELYLLGYHIWKGSSYNPDLAKHYEYELWSRRQRKAEMQQQQLMAQEWAIARAKLKAFQEEEDVEQRERELRDEEKETERRASSEDCRPTIGRDPPRQDLKK